MNPETKATVDDAVAEVASNLTANGRAAAALTQANKLPVALRGPFWDRCIEEYFAKQEADGENYD